MFLNLLPSFRRRPLHTLTTEEVIKAHENGTEQELMHGATSSEYVGDFVFGGIDGVITTFAVVAGVAGAHLAPEVVLIAGIASLLADGFAMGVGNFLSIRANQEHYNEEWKREAWEVDNLPDHEREELRELYSKQGFRDHILDELVAYTAANRSRWIEFMMREELGLTPETRSAYRAGGVTFLSFVIIGIIPLLSYVVALALPVLLQYVFPVSVAFTGVALFTVGALKTLVTRRSIWRSGVEILMVGSVNEVNKLICINKKLVYHGSPQRFIKGDYLEKLYGKGRSLILHGH